MRVQRIVYISAKLPLFAEALAVSSPAKLPVLPVLPVTSPDAHLCL